MSPWIWLAMQEQGPEFGSQKPHLNKARHGSLPIASCKHSIVGEGRRGITRLSANSQVCDEWKNADSDRVGPDAIWSLPVYAGPVHTCTHSSHLCTAMLAYSHKLIKKKKTVFWIEWCTPAISVLGRMKRNDGSKFKDSLDYIVRSYICQSINGKEKEACMFNAWRHSSEDIIEMHSNKTLKVFCQNTLFALI